jgi:hypothetical protein
MLTPAGERFLTATQSTLLAWQDEPVPDAARDGAEAAAREHRARWREHNPGL